MEKGHRTAEVSKTSETELLQACIAHLENLEEGKNSWMCDVGTISQRKTD